MIILVETILGLGTNIGNKEENLKNAIDSLKRVPKTKIIKVSRIYETKPFDVPDVQDNYLNCCVMLCTNLKPHTILGICLGIESNMGRQRPFKFSSRIIDIDLLLYDNFMCNDNDLILPHPHIKNRAFVMYPLNDLCVNQKFKNFDFSKEFNSINKSEIINIF